MKNAASFVGISPRLLFTWIDQGRVQSIRRSKHKLVFRPSDLVRAVEEIGEDYAAGQKS